MTSHAKPTLLPELFASAASPGPAPHAVAATAEDAGAAPRLRGVHRALGELRRGVPVLLATATGGEVRHSLVAAAETLGARGMALFAELAAQPALFLLPQSRAAAVLHRPVVEAIVAFRTAPALVAPATLKTLADPTAEHLLPPAMEVVGGGGDGPAPAAAIQLAKLCRLLPAALIARLTPAEAARLADDHALLVVATEEVAAYPADIAVSLTRVAETRVPLEASEHTRIVAFRPADGGIEHLAILVGQPEDLPADAPAPLARVHSECFTGDLLGSLKCDCGPQLQGAIAAMAEAGGGVVLYLAQEGRGIGLVNKLRAYALQDRGSDTLDANRQIGFGGDERDFAVAAAMLRALGIPRIRLMTNNPDKLAALAAHGIEVEGRVKHVFPTNGHNAKYLATKAERFGHLIG